MLTPIDEIANQNHLQLIKAAVAFLPPPSQRSLSLLIKLLELRNLSAFFQKQGSLHACNVASSASLPEMLAEMRNYCDGSELELIDQLGQGMLFDGIVFRHDAASRGRIVLKCEVYMSILRC